MTDAPVTEASEGNEPVEPAAEPESLHGCLVSWSRGQQVVHPTVEQYIPLMKALLDDGFELCADLTGIDYLAYPERARPDGVERSRFEVAVNLLRLDPPGRVRVLVQVPDDTLSLPSLFDLWPGTEAFEREVFDMFGITFEDHPDLTRILMPEDWVGHPLRKDYDTGAIPVQFKGVREAR
jgi:NADH-quinone oxidoreductase subunit C